MMTAAGEPADLLVRRHHRRLTVQRQDQSRFRIDRRSLLKAGAAAGIVLPLSTKAAAAASNGTLLWTESCYTSVFADSGPSPDSALSIDLDSARNDYEAGQIVLRRDRAFTITGVTVDGLTNGHHRISRGSISYNFVGYEYLDTNSVFDHLNSKQEVYPTIRRAPGNFPDRLLNQTDIRVAAGTSQSIWVTVYVPTGTAAGIYRGSATVHTDNGAFRVPVSINVRNVTIPSAVDGAFTNSLWQLFTGPISYDEGAGDTIKLFYGHDRYSVAWWQLLDNVAEVRKRHRTNDVELPIVVLLIDGGSSVDADGKYTFEWGRFDQVVEHFLAAGGIKRLEGFWSSGPQPGSAHWLTETIGRDDAGKAVRSYHPWDSVEVENWIGQFIPTLAEHLRSRGWATKWWMHIGDEPSGDEGLSGWTGLAGKVRSLWPSVQLGDATFSEPTASKVAANADILIPNLLNYNLGPAPYDTERAKGKELWLYNCNIPVAHYLNRFIDQPQWNQRLTMWYAYTRGATGYLHWAFNNWQFTMAEQEVKGDGFFVRPDKVRNTIESSPRYESLRDGIEDYEVLHVLGQRDPVLAKDLALCMAWQADKYTADIAFMQRIRRLVLDAAAGRPVIADDLARRRLATASSSSESPGCAIDGNPATGWRPAGDGTQWIQVDLGRQIQLDGIRLIWGAVGPTSYSVQISYDGLKWTDSYSTEDGRSVFIGVNGKARYIRVVITAGNSGYSLSALEVAGCPLRRPNLAGGRSYTKSSEPSARFPDTSGIESTDGLLATDWGDGRAYGYDTPEGTETTVDVTVDLGAERSVSAAKIHAYEEYPDYRPDTIGIQTSVDGRTFTAHGVELRSPNGPSGLWYDLAFPSTRARFVKATFSKVGTVKGTGIFIDDIEVY